MIKHKITDSRTAVRSLCLFIGIPPFRQGDHLLIFKNFVIAEIVQRINVRQFCGAFALYGIGAGFDGRFRFAFSVEAAVKVSEILTCSKTALSC